MSVFMRDRTHTYLMLTQSEYSGRFLTIDSGMVEVVTLPRVHEKFWASHDELVPYEYDFIKAVESYYTSTLQKTPEALSEMTALLEGKPVEDIKKERHAMSMPDKHSEQASKGRAAKAPKQAKAAAGGYSLADLCSDAGIDPSEARKKLRQAKIEKPGSRWEWPSAEAASHLLVILK